MSALVLRGKLSPGSQDSGRPQRVGTRLSTAFLPREKGVGPSHRGSRISKLAPLLKGFPDLFRGVKFNKRGTGTLYKKAATRPRPRSGRMPHMGGTARLLP